MTPTNARPPATEEVCEDTASVDLYLLGEPQRLSGYLIQAPRPAVVESGPSRSVQAWLDYLSSLDIPRDEIAYVIVTHVHLDHGGGAAQLLRELPHAELIVHPRGAPHIINPDKLVRGARSVFGDRLEKLWGLPQPADPQRLEAPEPNARLNLGGGHVLRFIEARGHARHQYMIFDEGTGALFTADELGIRWPLVSPCLHDYILPATAPNQFDPEAMISSARWLASLNPERVCFSHFGAAQSAPEVIAERVARQVEAFMGMAMSVSDAEDKESLTRLLVRHVREEIEALGFEWTETLAQPFTFDLGVSAGGLLDYRQRRNART